MRRLVLCLALAAFGFAPAPFPRPDPNKNDMQALQGEWVLVTEIQSGQKRPPRTFRATITAKQLVLFDGMAHKWTFEIDARAKPKAFTMRFKNGGLLRAAYSVEGSSLKIAYNMGRWAEKPSDLTGKGNSHCLWVFQRKKP